MGLGFGPLASVNCISPSDQEPGPLAIPSLEASKPGANDFWVPGFGALDLVSSLNPYG